MATLSDLLFSPLLFSRLRQKLIHHLQLRHFNDLNINVPLGHDCIAPISHQDYWYSFSEVFIQGEYDLFKEQLPLPNRWLDLGCHAGFFSLFVEWQWRVQGMSRSHFALLVDGDERLGPQVTRMIESNGLSENYTFAHGAISSSAGPLEFVERPCMASGIADSTNTATNSTRLVPVINSKQIMRLLAPPYDLIKVDIEGGEFDFLRNYGEVLVHTPVLLLEWHAWHSGGGGLSQIKAVAADLGFSQQLAYSTMHQKVTIGTDQECGLLLLQRPGT